MLLEETLGRSCAAIKKPSASSGNSCSCGNCSHTLAPISAKPVSKRDDSYTLALAPGPKVTTVTHVEPREPQSQVNCHDPSQQHALTGSPFKLFAGNGRKQADGRWKWSVENLLTDMVTGRICLAPVQEHTRSRRSKTKRSEAQRSKAK